MNNNESKLLNTNKFHLKQIAFPREHGSWGYTLEPLVLSLLVGFSVNGVLLALSTFIIFLAHQPIRIIFNKSLNNKLRIKAYLIFSIYAVSSMVLLILVLLDSSFYQLLPFFISVIIMFGYLLLELNNVKRNIVIELLAAVSVGLIAMNIVLLNGWNWAYAAAFWFVILSRAVPTTFYVRSKLQIAKKQPTQELSVFVSSFVSLLIVFVLTYFSYLPLLSIAAVLMLISRAYIGIYKLRGKLNVKKLGIMEFVYGIIFVLLVAAGYKFGI